MKKVLWTLGIIAGLAVVGIGGYVFYLYNSVENTVTEMHEPIEREVSEKRTEKIDVNKQDPISILLMGVDERPEKGDSGRSDTMIVMSINPNDKSIQMFNIPRDTRTEIIGKGFDDKINHAYAFGGAEMAMNTVENLLDVPIDYYIKVNMEALSELVDAVGGVTVNNKFAFTYGKHTFNKGENFLNGEEALLYSRMRKQDPRGDLGRNERQRQIITALINKGANFSSITKVDDILTALGGNIRTNLTFDEMIDIQKNYKEARHNIKTLEVSGQGQMINGIYYYIVSDEERTRISTELKQHLNISEAAETEQAGKSVEAS
ncbi:LytR family transcriptional regulator [Bacillus taeanensis]|uniref:Polyisoprenyl-teichoic acid--peptidoglycan teichoic acid transferase TagU n=1 Tax=Bacillus taeanensis TaxID=273032 RepID=A0A366XRE1_9BACI|nr:LytR family transcriptional regulator [Bacillus taeanensis]RBW68910.1 LytR family transcriptional regulator [Bacillus taeanensis]